MRNSVVVLVLFLFLLWPTFLQEVVVTQLSRLIPAFFPTLAFVAVIWFDPLQRGWVSVCPLRTELPSLGRWLRSVAHLVP